MRLRGSFIVDFDAYKTFILGYWLWSIRSQPSWPSVLSAGDDRASGLDRDSIPIAIDPDNDLWNINDDVACNFCTLVAMVVMVAIILPIICQLTG